MQAAAIQAREFEFSAAQFAYVQRVLKDRSGIDLGDGKRVLVYGRLVRRLRALGLDDFGTYLELIEDPDSDESGHFMNALTTNVTELFREEHHFHLLRDRVVPELAKSGAKRLRIWSAGCSAGDEPYSVALTLARIVEVKDWDIKILATDIDSDILARARSGTYDVERIVKLEAAFRSFFRRGVGANAGLARVSPTIASLITFRQLNLQDTWPMQGPFDVIFCRNVIIYFDPATRQRLVHRLASLLRPGGYLFLGHSEAPSGSNTPGLKSCGHTAFIRVAAESTR